MKNKIEFLNFYNKIVESVALVLHVWYIIQSYINCTNIICLVYNKIVLVIPVINMFSYKSFDIS